MTSAQLSSVDRDGNVNNIILQPGQLIRPQTSTDTARELVKKLYGLAVTSVKELASYDDRNYHVKVEREHSNPYVKEICPHGYVFKILNSVDSPKKHVEAEHEMLALLAKSEMCVPEPVIRMDGRDNAVETVYYTQQPHNNNVESSGDRPHGKNLVRLLTFVPGEILLSLPYKPQLMYRVGETLGRMNKLLQGFSHPELVGYQTIFSLMNVPRLEDFLFAVKDEENRRFLMEVITGFTDNVLPNLHKCTQSVIHGDYNEQNILVRPLPDQEHLPLEDREYENHGVIDFGDATDSYRVFDLGICIMYMMIESKIVDPLEVGGHVLAGFYENIQLNKTEKDLLKLVVAGRFCQSLVMGAYSYSMDPGNEYFLMTAKNGWRLLRRLWATPKEELYKKWDEIVCSYKKS